MDKLENGFNRFRRNTANLQLGEDFEDRVFAKIKKKKTQRKVATSAVLSIAVFAFLFVGQAVFFDRDPGSRMMTARSEQTVKEEVPVMEDVIFASSDSQTDYAIEQVAYNEGGYTI
jgi:hypothetical protein